ncbi:hypothetical protein [Akkermansia sp.]|uniref:hypothetical protein n=1 Tax=Akkermansia sp. TaxID=1872421 RepID=UPI003A94D682
MCKAAEWYLRLVDWIDRHKTTACMIAGFLVAYWMGEKFDAWNDKMLAVMHEQTAAQVETGKALQELAVRINGIERKLEK